MSPRKDWKDFEKRREEAVRHGSRAPRSAPLRHPQHYENNAYDYERDSYENYGQHGAEFHQARGPQNYYNHDHSQLPYADALDHITSLSSHRGYTPEPTFYDPSPIEKKRKCRDLICVGFFLSAIVLMVGVTAYAVLHGDLMRFTNGVDLSCDICGIQNEFLPGIENSGKDLRNSNYLHTLQIQQRGGGAREGEGDESRPHPHLPTQAPLIRTVSKECVAQCPPKSKIVLNRCVSTEKEDKRPIPHHNRTARITSNALRIDDLAEAAETVNDFFYEVGEDLENCWEEILWMCLISLGVAILVTVLLRLFAGIIVWILVSVVSLTGIGGSIALWGLWLTKRNDPGSWTESQVASLLIASIVSSVLTVIILLILLFLRKRIALVIQLFNEAGKAVHAMPLILFQPILTFLALGVALSSWMIVAILIETSGRPVEVLSNTTAITDCQYKKDTVSIFSRWWNLFMMIWMTQFIMGCQHMIIAGAVSIWFFKRDKRRLGFPIALSYKRLLRYHLGSVAFGSLIIAIVKLVRYVLNTIQKRLGGTNALCKGLLWCCQCCVWCLEKFLIFLNRNAYIEIAIYGYGFCKSARKAFKVIVNNALRLAAINSIGDFVLFLAKLSIVALSVFIGYELIKNKDGLHHIWVPLMLGGIFAYFVAHCFISVYEMAIDTVFLCFCEDSEMNDGLEKPYYMSKGLMEFMKNSEKVLKARKKGEAKGGRTNE